MQKRKSSEGTDLHSRTEAKERYSAKKRLCIKRVTVHRAAVTVVRWWCGWWTKFEISNAKQCVIGLHVSTPQQEVGHAVGTTFIRGRCDEREGWVVDNEIDDSNDSPTRNYHYSINAWLPFLTVLSFSHWPILPLYLSHTYYGSRCIWPSSCMHNHSEAASTATTTVPQYQRAATPLETHCLSTVVRLVHRASPPEPRSAIPLVRVN